MVAKVTRNPSRASASAVNPNSGKRRGGHINVAPRLSDGRRHPVTILQAHTGRRPTRLGTRPHRIARRVPWTVERLLICAERAEARGHVRIAEELLTRALEVEGSA